MKLKTKILGIAAVVLLNASVGVLPAAGLPKIRVLATGGTIAGAQASATD